MLHVVPVSHLKTGMQGRANIIISLNRKIFNYYDYSINYYKENYFKLNSNATSRLATWRLQATEIAMRRHFATSTGRRRRVFKSDRNWSSAQRYDGASRIHDNRLPFYNRHILQISSIRHCTNFVRVSQTQTTTFIYRESCDPICIRF